MALPIRLVVASCLLLVPSLARAASEDSCAHATYEDPQLHPTNQQPMARDGWIAIEAESGYYEHPFTNVRVRDGEGREIATTPVFDETTVRRYEVFAPVQPLEAGAYELVFTNSTNCFGLLEVVLPLTVADALAEPIEASPVIDEIEAKVFDEVALNLEIEIPAQTVPGWVLVEADFAPQVGWWADALVAYDEPERVVFHRDVEGEDVSEICVRVTFYDLAGAAGPTHEQCTTEVEHISSAQPSLPLQGCRVGGTSPTWALGLLLVLGLGRRRRS